MNNQVLEAKKETVTEIVNSIKGAASVTVVSYQGLTVAELQELRKTLKETGSTMGVYKNTLVTRALKDGGYPEMADLLNGPNAFVFSEDLSKGPKALVKFSRYHEKLVVKGGLAEGRVVTKEQMVTISKLPDKNGMIAMFLSCLQAPVRSFACAVNAIAEKNGAPAPEAAAPAAAN